MDSRFLILVQMHECLKAIFTLMHAWLILLQIACTYDG